MLAHVGLKILSNYAWMMAYIFACFLFPFVYERAARDKSGTSDCFKISHKCTVMYCICSVNYVLINCYESWVVPAGVPSALADIGGRVEANY